MTDTRTTMRQPVRQTTGVVYVHCCPAALAPHVEWAIAGVLDRPVRMQWTGQPVAPSHLRADYAWSGPVGTAAALAAAVRAWPMLVFEITEGGTTVSDGERLAHVPGRGFHRSVVSVNGDVLVNEERLRGLLSRARNNDELRHGLDDLIGSAWDAELEPYRRGGDGLPVSVIPAVG